MCLGCSAGRSARQGAYSKKFKIFPDFLQSAKILDMSDKFLSSGNPHLTIILLTIFLILIPESGTIIRTCLDSNPNDMAHTCRTMENNSKTASADKMIKYCSVCDKDNCNAAGSLSFSLPLAATALFASYLLYKQ